MKEGGNIMNKVNFGTLVAFVSGLLHHGYDQLTHAHIETLDAITDEPPVVVAGPPSEFLSAEQRNLVWDLIRCVAENRKIEAIKIHRALTGFALKESKDALETLNEQFNIKKRET
jgi:ribosomal protein L7/L12